MTADAQNPLNMALSSHLRQLAELDVTEQAETIVRDAYNRHLMANVDSVLVELDIIAEHAAPVRDGNDLNATAQDEQRLCGIQHLADSILSRHTFHADTAQRAQATYQQERLAILRRIQSLQAALEACQQISRHHR